MMLFGLDRYETVAVDVCELDGIFAKIANVAEDAEGMFSVNRHMVEWFASNLCYEIETEDEFVLVVSHDTTRLYGVTDYFEWVAKASSRSLATFFVVLSTVNESKVRFTRIS